MRILRKLLLVFSLAVGSAGAYGQVTKPDATQLPQINAVPYNWFKGYVRIDSAFMPPVRDTNFIPIVVNTMTVRPQDSASYVWNGRTWFPERGFSTVTQLFQRRGTHRQITSIRGYYSEGDGGEASYRWDEASTATIDSGSVIALPGLAIGRWLLLTNRTAVNAKVFGVKSGDTTFDNAPRLNAALTYSSTYGIPIVLHSNTASNFTYKSQITVPQSADFEIGNNCKLICYMSNTDSTTVHIKVMNETRVDMKGELNFNGRLGRAIYINGHDGVYRKSEEDWNFNVRGDQLTGQIAMYILADGLGAYGSAPVSYIKRWHNQFFNVDYAIYARSVNRGSINNNIITGAYGQTLRGMYFFSDLSVDTTLGIGRASINYLTLVGNITSSPNTKQLVYLSGVSGSVIDMKLEDAGRYADSSNLYAFYSDKNCIDNDYELKGFKSQNFHDEGSGNNFNFHSHRKGILDIFGAQSNTVLPNGTLPRKAGSLDDYLLGASVDGGLEGKPGVLVTTNSNTTDDLNNLFDNDATTRVLIGDAGNQERQIKIAFDHPVRGFAGGVEFGSLNAAPSYVRVEAWSTDSARKYTLYETDTGWYNFNLWYNFNGKIFKDTPKAVIINGIPDTVIKRQKKPLTRMDTLYVTVKGANWETPTDTINMDRIWLFVEGENAKSYIGNGEGDQDLYRRLQLRKGANLHNDTLTNAFLETGLMYHRDIDDFEKDTIWVGHYSYTNATLNGPPGSNLGTVVVLKTGIDNKWIKNTGHSLSFIAHDLTNNVIWRRGYKHTTNTYTAWDSTGGGGGGGGGGPVDWEDIDNVPAEFPPEDHTHPLSEITDEGTMASQNASSVAITGGTITGVTELELPTASTTTNGRIWLSSNILSYRSGGATYNALRASSNLSDVSSASTALTNILPAQAGQANRVLTSNGTSASWVAPPGANILGFDSISSGTNTTAAMVVGTGASITVAGTGIVEATKFKGAGTTSDSVDLATAEVGGTLPLNKGGTNAKTAAVALNNLLPSQSGNAGLILGTNGTTAAWVADQTASGGTGDVTSNTSTSVDNEIALFNSTTGKQIKRATGSGIAKITSGVLGTATSGTDYAPATPSGTAILKANNAGGFSNAVAGTDYPAVVNYAFLALTDAATVDWNVTRPNAQVTIAGNRLLNMTNTTEGITYTLFVTQGTGGNRTLAFPATTFIPLGFGTGTVPNLSTTVGAVDMINIIKRGANFYLTIVKNYVQ